MRKNHYERTISVSYTTTKNEINGAWILDACKKCHYLLLKMFIIDVHISLALYREKQWHFETMAFLEASLYDEPQIMALWKCHCKTNLTWIVNNDTLGSVIAGWA